MDLLDYFAQFQSSPLFIKDKTYDKIVDHLDEFIKNISEEKDKQILLQVISKCYLKYQGSIKNNGDSIFELNIKMLMTMLIDQKLQYDKL
jgi:hypothetical protein